MNKTEAQKNFLVLKKIRARKKKGSLPEKLAQGRGYIPRLQFAEATDHQSGDAGSVQAVHIDRQVFLVDNDLPVVRMK